MNKFIIKIGARLKEKITDVIKLRLSPVVMATSVSLGVFVGAMFPIGLQTITVVPLAILFRCNPIVSAMTTLISNPLTLLPLYLGAWKAGTILTGKNIGSGILNKVIQAPTWSNISAIGYDGLMIFIPGLLIVSVTLATLAFIITLLIYRISGKND